MRIIPHKKEKGLCVAYRCQSKSTPKNRFCSKHNHRYQKEKNPVEYTFMLLRVNAKRRGKSFELTIEQFRQFCKETNYIELKGKLKKSATIDRIDSSRGYSIDNIQILTLSQNASKGDKPEDDPF